MKVGGRPDGQLSTVIGVRLGGGETITEAC